MFYVFDRWVKSRPSLWGTTVSGSSPKVEQSKKKRKRKAKGYLFSVLKFGPFVYGLMHYLHLFVKLRYRITLILLLVLHLIPFHMKCLILWLMQNYIVEFMVSILFSAGCERCIVINLLHLLKYNFSIIVSTKT